MLTQSSRACAWLAKKTNGAATSASSILIPASLSRAAYRSGVRLLQRIVPEILWVDAVGLAKVGVGLIVLAQRIFGDGAIAVGQRVFQSAGRLEFDDLRAGLDPISGRKVKRVVLIGAAVILLVSCRPNRRGKGRD